MGRHRALLIGTSEYDMRGVASLPFIPGDLARLGAVLRDRGFDEVQVLAGREGGKQVSANYVNGRVIGFLRRARPGDTLFILLSGHGVHAKGRDYLVPEDIDEDTHPFESGCVAIDWREHLDDTPASQVVFLIDACREGIEPQSMGVASVRQWSRQKVSAALRRKVAYVYACSPAQLALFVRPHDLPGDPVADARPGDSFSLFSRSVSDVITAGTGLAPLTLDTFREAVQDRVTALHRAYHKAGPPQTLRVVTDIPSDSFAFLPTPPTRPHHHDDTPQDAGAAMSVGPAAPPPDPRRRTHRRVLPALALLAVLAGAAWAAVHYGGYGGDGDKGGGRDGKAVSALSTTPRPSASPSPSPSPSPSVSPSSSPPPSKSSEKSVLPTCTADSVSFAFRSAANSFAANQRPVLRITVDNRTGADCSIDLGPGKTVVTITRAGDDSRVYSTADCPEGSASQLVRVPAKGNAVRTVTWDRRPTSPSCGSASAAPAGPGTYLAEAEPPGLAKAMTSFVLEAD
ncbi:caspase family protein [Streptomyces antibioticus]|uniref:caspase family protein n=1 Tax=Streptomyces antibioticus TaxID=1890 RepID=UPI00224F2912|nr:caspase family protein [Streptomyces antibioticus]MCX4741418.1 caspase family protein [Streptomyces antibioticus]